MSGIAGVFMRAGEPVDLRTVQTMAGAAPKRARDGAWTTCDGPFAAVRQRTVTTVEDEPEREPVTDRAARLAMLFDGRLDNRDELADALGISPAERAALPDAWLALVSWKKWREETPCRLLGDFAFVVWDGEEQSLFCARDPMGVRPLFYWLSDRAFVFGSEVRQVLAHPLVPRAPDDVMAGGLLSAGLPRVSERTLYRDVWRLPHAHALLVTHDRATRRRYWQIDLGHELKLSSDAEYAEAFRDVFDRAVAARVRSRGVVGAYLSGGLDSSSIVVSARGVSEANRALPPTAFSLIFPGHPAADEREYGLSVLRQAGVPGVQIVPAGMDPAALRAQAAARKELPDFPHDRAGDDVRRAMALRGIRVALTGSGGDVGLSGSHFHYADLLRRLHLVRFWRRYVDVARQPAMSWTSADILPCAVWPLLPAGLRRLLRPIARRLGPPGVPPWMTSELAHRAGLTEVPPLRHVPAGRLARTDVHDGFDNGWARMALDMYQRGSIEWGIEDRHPFFDRRMIEFVLSLPDEQRWQKGTTRYVLRRALSGRLPDQVRDRPDDGKGDLSHLYWDALEVLGGAAFFADSLEIAAHGWIVAREARRLYERMLAQRAAGDPAYGDAAFRLWNIAAVEMWYEEVFGSRAGRSAWPIEKSDTSSAPRGPEKAANHIAAPC